MFNCPIIFFGYFFTVFFIVLACHPDYIIRIITICLVKRQNLYYLCTDIRKSKKMYYK